MVRVDLPVQTTAKTGVVLSYVAADAANGHSFTNTAENVVLHVKNAGGGDTTLTFITPGTVEGQAIGDYAVVVSAGTEEIIGPFNNANFGVSRVVSVDIDVDTSVTIAAVKTGTP